MRSEEEIRKRLELRRSSGFDSTVIFALILELEWVLSLKRGDE